MPSSSFNRDFVFKLSFDQELREMPLGSGIFLPASKTLKDPKLRGKGNLHFNSDFSSIEVDLKITGNLVEDREITLVHLHLNTPNSIGPLTVELYPSSIKHNKIKVTEEQFLLEYKITNDDIIPCNNGRLTTNTVASLYNAILEGSLYLDCHGKGEYLLGMLRAQIY